MTKLFIPIKAKDKKVDEVLKLEEFFIERKFGKTSHYLIADTEKDNFILVVNTNHHFGGNKSSADIADENGAETVVAAHMGRGAYDKLVDKGISILRGDLNVDLSRIIEKYKNDELDEFSQPEEHKHDHDDHDQHH